MNRIFSEDANGKLVVCVLEPGNIFKMCTERDPIRFSLNEGPYANGLPAKLSVMLAYSETPVADARDLMQQARQVIDSRTPRTEKVRPHCPECRSSLEQLGVWRSDESPVLITFCSICGCVLGTMARDAAGLRGLTK